MKNKTTITDFGKALLVTARNDFDHCIAALEDGDINALEDLSEIADEFPTGEDTLIGGSWLGHAIPIGNIKTIEWMIDKGADVNKTDIGYTMIQTALETNLNQRFEIVELLLKKGADINAHGTQDWTALHMATVRDDREAMKLLLKFGADPTIRTRIDDCATPVEEARLLGAKDAADFLKDLLRKRK